MQFRLKVKKYETNSNHYKSKSDSKKFDSFFLDGLHAIQPNKENA